MEITAKMVKELRERTGAGMMDCKSALVEADGDLDEVTHAGGRIGGLLEINCETDFVARTDDFETLVRDIAMHIAAADPRFVERDEVTDDVLAHEREIYREQALASGKPEHIVDRIVDGKMDKFFGETVLLEQAFVKNPDQTVGELVTEAVAKMGENIRVRRFARFKLGEGLTKREDDFAAEVADAAG